MIEEIDSTTFLPSGAALRVDVHRNLIVSVEAGAA